ncbi:Hypothetical predicted protein [Podarcis lilfordi]|uniref:Uncharacterized protein n=1 Tax=Podarcis lilfordi TaxID=74358 RepID=A0AA35LEM0_9SAUR|nr:Hypothetical predicted protein [Podarcis lilfordi]
MGIARALDVKATSREGGGGRRKQVLLIIGPSAAFLRLRSPLPGRSPSPAGQTRIPSPAEWGSVLRLPPPLPAARLRCAKDVSLNGGEAGEEDVEEEEDGGGGTPGNQVIVASTKLFRGIFRGPSEEEEEEEEEAAAAAAMVVIVAVPARLMVLRCAPRPQLPIAAAVGAIRFHCARRKGGEQNPPCMAQRRRCKENLGWGKEGELATGSRLEAGLGK